MVPAFCWEQPCGHLSHVLYGKLPGGSGNAQTILAQLGGQGFSDFPRASLIRPGELSSATDCDWVYAWIKG
jgi:hypothetical protein